MNQPRLAHSHLTLSIVHSGAARIACHRAARKARLSPWRSNSGRTSGYQYKCSAMLLTIHIYISKLVMLYLSLIQGSG